MQNSSASDTIAAIATASGRGAVGLLRLSGPAVPCIARALVGAELPAPRHAALRALRDSVGEVIDYGLVLYFPAPHSYTGEAVLELQMHGSPVVLDRMLARACELGARPARPGEFSQRAFLNGKLDLTQAEAVADLIGAGSVQAARAAQRSLQGEFSKRVQTLLAVLIELRAYIEAAIDFVDEELELLGAAQIDARLSTLLESLKELQTAAAQGRALRDGLTVVILGPPNAGKSSLLNRLAGHDSAIVTPIPGTTRDVLRELIHIDGMPLHVLDTAGLRDSADPIEQEGMRRALRAAEQADHILLVVDDNTIHSTAIADLHARLPEDIPRTLVRNKCDLSGSAVRCNHDELWLSAHTGAGLDELCQRLKAAAGLNTPETSPFLARRRHLEALQQAQTCVLNAQMNWQTRQTELLAEELRLAQQALNEITGVFTTDDLLGRIFSQFCIGK